MVLLILTLCAEPQALGVFKEFDMEWLTMKQWSPYVAGVGIGILSCITFLLSDKPIGCSTAFSRTSGMIEKLFRGGIVAEKAYYKRFAPSIEWEWMLVVGIFIGAFLSAKLSSQFQPMWVPLKWASTFGNSSTARWAVALIGGTIMGMGARWAGGCTSGHGISGTLQLAVSSWIAVICFFIGGVATAMFIFNP
jgi:uncharacterized membrane protein YedE/YeeE